MFREIEHESARMLKGSELKALQTCCQHMWEIYEGHVLPQ